MKLIDAIPEHMRGGLARYIEHHIEPGSFLRAVLENDLKGAISYADSTNRFLLFDYVNYLYNDAPSVCWGSPEKVAAWLAMRQE